MFSVSMSRRKFVWLIALGALLVFSFVQPLSGTAANRRVVAQDTSNDDAIDAREKQLQAELDAKLKEIAEISVYANEKSQERASLERDVALLEAEIKKTQLQIQARNINIKQLGGEIVEHGVTLQALTEKYARQKASLAKLIRETNQIDDNSVIELALSHQNISDFFVDLDTFDSINVALQNSFHEITVTKAATESEKKSLEAAHTKEIDLKYQQELEQQKIKERENEKSYVLGVTKGQESLYNQLLEQKRAEAARISAQLFALRDTEGIKFGDALQYAKVASKATGVRTALILAILTQESDLGKNQGSCAVTDIETGDGVGKNTGTPFEKVMKAPRDTVPFKDITDRLGRNWATTFVSCPPGQTWTANRGYGGGMGPSQFIPSTWELFKARIGPAVGVSVDQADPWNPAHSFMATAIYLSDLGAGAGGYSAERDAACRYYSGRACDNQAPANTFYGDSVIAKSNNIQTTMIDPIEDANKN